MIETCTVKSKTLHSDVTCKVIIPQKIEIHKVLILLHGNIYPEGAFFLIENLPKELSLEELCEKYHMMVIIPYMKSCYYISSEEYNCDRFIAGELVDWIHGQYGFKEDPELILGGISMGGYGASLISSHTSIFEKIISVSGAYITNDIIIGNPEVWGDRKPTMESAIGSYLYYFLPLSEVEDSMEKNVFASISMFKKNQINPVFFIACGTKDWLYDRNLFFAEKLKEQGIGYDFYSIPDGDHDADCFKMGLWATMERLEHISVINRQSSMEIPCS